MHANNGSSKEVNGLNAKVGPFHDQTDVMSWLGKSLSQLTEIVRRGEILCTPTDNGTPLYPTFQFAPTGDALPGLSAVLQVLDPHMQDPWGDALWLNTSTSRFKGFSAAELLRRGDLLVVLDAAHSDAAVWAR